MTLTRTAHTLQQIVGYSGANEWWKEIEVTDEKAMVEIGQVTLNEAGEIEVLGFLSNADGERLLAHPRLPNVVIQSGLNPSTVIYLKKEQMHA